MASFVFPLHNNPILKKRRILSGTLCDLRSSKPQIAKVLKDRKKPLWSTSVEKVS
jgi:hypothetical protein